MKLVSTMAAALLAALTALPAAAGTITGIIKDPVDKELHGVQVRITDDASGVSEAVFTNPDRRYELVTRLQGELKLRAPD